MASCGGSLINKTSSVTWSTSSNVAMRCQPLRVEVVGLGLRYFIFMQGGIGNYNLQLRVLKAGPEDEAFLPMRPNHAFLAEISHHENSIGLPHCY